PVYKHLSGVWMGRILHDRHHPAAIIGVGTFLETRNRFDRQAGFYKRVVTVMTEADRERELSFRQTIGNLPLILSDKEILLRELTEKFFPFNLPEKSPRVLPRTRIARIQKPDPTLPFGVQQIVKRANLLRLYLTRVIPKGLAGVTEKGIDVPLRADVILPDVPAPPVFRIFHFGQDHVRLKIIRRPSCNHRKRRGSPGHKDIEVTDAGAVLFYDARYILRTPAGKKLYVDTKLLFEPSTHRFP